MCLSPTTKESYYLHLKRYHADKSKDQKGEKTYKSVGPVGRPRTINGLLGSVVPLIFTLRTMWFFTMEGVVMTLKQKPRTNNNKRDHNTSREGTCEAMSANLSRPKRKIQKIPK